MHGASMGLARYIEAATRLRLPGDYMPLRFGAEAIGYVRPEIAARLGGAGGVVVKDETGLQQCAAILAEAGHFKPRGELFDVRAHPDGPVLARLDRGALPCLGIQAAGVHVNGLVHTPNGPRLWLAKRSATTRLEPGKLDNLIGGGIPAGMNAADTLIKEADEEASIAAPMALQARHVATLTYAWERPEGLRRDRLFCYDLALPADFHPTPNDGEVEGFRLFALPDVLARLRDTNDFKFNVPLVLIDLLARHGLIDPATLPGLAILRGHAAG